MSMMISSAASLGGGGAGGTSLSVSVSPSSAFGGRSQTGAVKVNTEYVTAVGLGGSGVYTYSWAIVGSPSGTWTISNPTAATTRFSRDDVADLETYIANFRCTVNDGVNSAVSGDVEATVTNYGL